MLCDTVSGVDFGGEQRICLGDLLRSVLPCAGSAEIARLDRAVSASMDAWRAERAAAGTFRGASDALRGLWLLVASDDPPVGLIRCRVSALPVLALAEVERRARWLWPGMFGVSLPAAGLVAWSQDAAADDLIRGLRVVIAGGAGWVPGRLRPDGRRSRCHLEPDVLGVVRRGVEAPGTTHRHNGRPRDTAGVDLVMMLAVDWCVATGAMPQPGRSDETPFGALVHHVFGWLELDNASSALRRYWRLAGRQSPLRGLTWH